MFGVRRSLICPAGCFRDRPAGAIGYPDLRLVQTASNRVFYLDPKLYPTSSEKAVSACSISSQRPRRTKCGKTAVHLLVGFEYEPKTAGHWKFIHWDLADLAHFKVRLKAEFQGSNRDIYRAEAVVATSKK